MRTAPLGDFILTLPVFTTLRAAHKDAEIVAMCSVPHGQLLVAGELADSYVNIWDRAFWDFLLSERITPFAEHWVRSFDLVVSYVNDPNRIFTRAAAGSTTHVLQSKRAGFNDGLNRHASVTALQPLMNQGYRPEILTPWLRIPEVNHIGGKYVVIHPHSGNIDNNYSVEHWINVVDRIHNESKLNIIVTAGPRNDELARARKIVRKLKRARVLAALTLVDIATLIRNAHGYYGQDSGVTHLASAVDCRSLIFWPNGTNRDIWRPAGSNVHITQDPGLPTRDLLWRYAGSID